MKFPTGVTGRCVGSRVRQPGWGHWGTREGGALLLSWPPAPTRTPCTWPLQSASGASLKRCRPLLHFQLTPKHAYLCPHRGRQSPPWASSTRMARLRLSRVPKLSVKPPSYQCPGRRGTMFFHNDNQRLPTPTARPWPASSPGELPSPQPGLEKASRWCAVERHRARDAWITLAQE